MGKRRRLFNFCRRKFGRNKANHINQRLVKAEEQPNNAKLDAQHLVEAAEKHNNAELDTQHQAKVAKGHLPPSHGPSQAIGTSVFASSSTAGRTEASHISSLHDTQDHFRKLNNNSHLTSLQIHHNHSTSFEQGSNRRHISQQSLGFGLDATGRTVASGGTAMFRNLSGDSRHSGFSASSTSSATTISYGKQSQISDSKPTFLRFDSEKLTQLLYEEIYQFTKLRLQSNHYESDARHTPSFLGWPIPATEHLKYYSFKVPNGKQPYLELAQSREAPPEMPSKVYLDSSDFKKGTCFCKFPNGCCMSFKRPADLNRHYMNVHASDDQRLQLNCDYSKCPRSNDPFNRKDYYRDHLKDYYKKDIGAVKQAKGATKKEREKAQKKWIKERQITVQWWRCAKCLVRVKGSWICYQCKQTCETERIKIREEIAQDSNHQQQMNEELPAINYNNDYEQESSSSFSLACVTCTGVGYLQNMDGIIWAPCYACKSQTNGSVAGSYYRYDTSCSNY